MKKSKMYILTREDLTPAYRACQAGHALAAFMLKHPTQAKEWGNHTLIYLQIENEEELAYWGEKLDRRDITWEGFREPDLGNQLTGIACYCDGKPFANLKLLKDE